ncbi:hypothetical protein BME24068_03188 [Burkholderia metallica]|nr:hypothetical protein BME24068_03188 [Burkholderia metallica]
MRCVKRGTHAAPSEAARVVRTATAHAACAASEQITAVWRSASGPVAARRMRASRIILRRPATNGAGFAARTEVDTTAHVLTERNAVRGQLAWNTPRPFAASHKRHPLPRPSPCNEQRVMGFSGIGTASRLRVVVHGHRRALPARRIRSPRFGARSSSAAASPSIVVSRTTSCAPVQRYWRAPPLPTIVHTLDRQTSETRCTTPDVALANRAALRGLPTR